MDELVNQVATKTGLSEEDSRKAVEVVIEYLKMKLPAPIAGQLENFISGGGQGGDLGDLAQGLGGFLGKK